MEGWRIYGGGGLPSNAKAAWPDDLSQEPDAQEVQWQGGPQDNPNIGQPVMWVGYPGCPICQANADMGVVPYGTVFPSGQTDPPAHEHCQCDLIIAERMTPPPPKQPPTDVPAPEPAPTPTTGG